MSRYLSDNVNSFNVSNVSNHFTVADHRSEILAWLSPLEPQTRHQDIRTRRVNGVGSWLLQTEEFRSWCDGGRAGESDNATLFCCGNPGVGKTYISSVVIDTLCDQARGQNITVACFYFHFAAQKEQSSASVMGALLKQIVSGLDTIPEEIVQEFRDQRKAIGGRALQLTEIERMLRNISSSQRIFLCIDALDECAVENRQEVLDSLSTLQNSPDIRIFLTGRPHITSEIERYLAGTVRIVSIRPTKNDIVIFLRVRISKDATPDAMDSRLEADILQKIPENISDIFLLVSLNIEAILQEPTIYRRRQRLNLMTDGLGLGDAYSATLERIKAQGGEKARLGMATLMWISHWAEPLNVDGLCHALAVVINSADFNPDNVPSIGTLLGCCQGLVTLDEAAFTFRLIHSTLQEYLLTHPDLLGRADSMIGETCLTYLNTQQVNDLSIGNLDSYSGKSFLHYCSLYWGVHALQTELSSCAKSLALKLLDQYEDHVSAVLLLDTVLVNPRFHDIHSRCLFAGLHCASFLGIVEVVRVLVEMKGCDVNQADHLGFTPLSWAVRSRTKEVLKYLLGQENIIPDKPSNLGQTPLMQAAHVGSEEAIKLLLEREDVDPNKRDKFGCTSLWRAAERGHVRVVKLLLERRDVNPNTPDMMGNQTPLLVAAKRCREEVVKLLLERKDVNPDIRDKCGGTPLYWAARYGHEGCVKLLREGKYFGLNISLLPPTRVPLPSRPLKPRNLFDRFRQKRYSKPKKQQSP